MIGQSTDRRNASDRVDQRPVGLDARPGVGGDINPLPVGVDPNDITDDELECAADRAAA